jgi:hypothetical protein
VIDRVSRQSLDYDTGLFVSDVTHGYDTGMFVSDVTHGYDIILRYCYGVMIGR